MKQDLSPKKKQVADGNDSIVIQKYISGIKGGRTLNMDGFPLSVVKAGHVIIAKDGDYRPMPIVDAESDGNYAYGTLTTGYSYVGVLYRSVPKDAPAASVMTNGEVNSEAVPYAMTSILSAFKTACPHIVFVKDEEA